MSDSQTLTPAQQETIRRLAKVLAAAATWVERDEPNDTHVFVSFQARDGGGVTELIVEADGSVEQ